MACDFDYNNMLSDYEEKYNVVLVLTGTVTPFISFKLNIDNPASRLQEYVNAVSWYLNNTTYKVVFCENSGYIKFKEHLSCLADENFNRRFEYITFIDKETRCAGYGECNILRRVQNESVFIKDASIIMKCTGRLILTNINSVLRQFKGINHSFFAGDYASDFNSMNTTFFAFTPDLFNGILEIQKSLTSENYIEKAIMQFVHSQIKKDSESVLYFKRPLFVSGKSGHYGTVYDTPKWKKPLRYIYKQYRLFQWHKVKRNFLSE